jgi:uncharacterized protein
MARLRPIPFSGLVRVGLFLLFLAFVPRPTAADLESGLRAAERGEHDLALWDWIFLAQRGDPVGQYRLATAYYWGDGTAPDLARAAAWFRRAAEQGHRGAQFNLGLMHDTGRGVAEERAEALAWYRRAAEQGHPHAQHNLGVLYRNGRGVPRDLGEAARWYLRAAAQGHVPAQVKAALMYDDGEGVALDAVEAHRWYSLAHGQLAGRERDEIAMLIGALEPRLTPAQLAEARRLAREWTPRLEPRLETGERTAPVWPRALARVTDPELPPGRRGGETVRVGFGVVVDPAGHVLTSADLVQGCGEVWARSAVDRFRLAAVVARDIDSDLALLRIGPGAAPAAFRPATGPAGAPAALPARGLVATPAGAVWGTISEPGVPEEPGRFLPVSPTAPVDPSGAPLLDERGHVIGVLMGAGEGSRLAGLADVATGTASFAVPGSQARSFLAAHRIETEVAPPGPVLASGAVAEQARAFTVTVECRR